MQPTDRPSTEILLADDETDPATPLQADSTATRRACHYVGRFGGDARPAQLLQLPTFNRDGTLDVAFEDDVLPATLLAAMTAVDMVIIHDPLSFPWNSIDVDIPTPIIVDASRCCTNDLNALYPVLSTLTEADTLLLPAPPSPNAVPPLPESVPAMRSEVPTPKDWAALCTQKQLHRFDQRIHDRAAREVGAHVLLHRLDHSDFTSSDHEMPAVLAEIENSMNARLVGLWGVRTAPGVRVNHAWAVLEPSGGSH